MRIAAIGDPHGNLKGIRSIPLNDVDLALLTGDLGRTDILRRQALDYLAISQPTPGETKAHAEGFRQAFLRTYETALEIVRYLAGYCPVLIVRGNADLSGHDTRKFARTFNVELPFLYSALLTVKGVRLIDNRVAVTNGLRIGGIKYFTDLSWAKEFELSGIEKIRKIAAKDTQLVQRVLERFGPVDILLTHIPPYGVLDRVDSASIPPNWIGRHAGSKAILEYIEQRHPDYLFCGHIHESAGFARVGKTQVFNLGAGGYRIIELGSNI